MVADDCKLGTIDATRNGGANVRPASWIRDRGAINDVGGDAVIPAKEIDVVTDDGELGKNEITRKS